MKLVRKTTRRGKPRLVIDIPYTTPAGEKRRYRKDASVQTMTAARAEAKRLVLQLAQTGELPNASPSAASTPAATPAATSFADAVEHYRRVHLPQKKASTRRGYEVIIRSELLPRLGSTPLDEVDEGVFDTLDTELIEAGLTDSTRRNVQVVLRGVLKRAHRAKLLAALPVFPPLPSVCTTVMVAPISWDEFLAIDSKSSKHFRIALRLAIFAGLRAGEIRGLRWTDVDLERREITVRRSICRGVEGVPKSRRERPVGIAQALLEVLVDAEPTKSSPWATVAHNGRGGVWSEWGLRSAFHAAGKKAGLEPSRFHATRHFFVSELFRLGIPAHTIRELAGHRELSTTQRYAHAHEDDLRAAVDALDAGHAAAKSK